MKKLFLLITMMGFIFIGFGVFAQEDLYIIPKVDDRTNVGDVVSGVAKGGEVWKNYNDAAAKLQKNKDLGGQMASGIFTWSTLLDYLVYLIRFMSQAGLFVGACFIIYAGYIYASHVFTGKSVSDGNKAITNAIVGVVIITFSYAIMKAVTAAFLS